MARRRILPEDNWVLERLILKHGASEVARMYNVTRQAVSIAIRDRNLNVPRRTRRAPGATVPANKGESK